MRNSFISILMFMVILFMGCEQDEPKYIIGVSQCSEDIWRDWQNAEMRMEANFHEGLNSVLLLLTTILNFRATR